MIKLSIKLGILLLAAVAVAVLLQQSQLAVLALSRRDPLPDVRAMVAEGRYAEAADYLGFFMDYAYINQNSEAQALDQEIAERRGKFDYQVGKLVEGLFAGTSDETIGQVAGVMSDFLVIGDLRDLAVQGGKLAQGEETDKVMVALASLGVIATGAQIAGGVGTVATGGAAAPTVAATTAAKSGLVVLKTARKLGKLPPWLGKTIIKAGQTARETKSLGTVTDLLGDVNMLAKTRGGFTLLSRTRDAVSLKRMATFAEIFSFNSATLYRIGGDLVVNTAQHAGTLGKDTIQLAATFGRDGLRVLDKVGAIKFVKYSARASKMAIKGDVFHLVARLLLRVPDWMLYALVALGAVVWLPCRALQVIFVHQKQEK